MCNLKMNENIEQLRKRKIIQEETERIKKENLIISDEDILEKIKKRLTEYYYDFDDDSQEYAKSQLKKYDNGICSINDFSTIPCKHSNWLIKETIDKDTMYWSVYKRNIKKYLQLSDEDIGELEDVCLDVVNRLVPPCSEYDSSIKKEYYKVKGLVYGKVQAGKTASMGGLISQYVSMGCNFVIVLSGVHNNLWEQTQNRLRRDLDIDNQGGGILSWNLITDNKDGIPPTSTSFFSNVSGGANRIIGVFKKNSSVLKKLLSNYLKVDDKTQDKSFLSRISLLVIDDECDQASPDVSKENSEERSKINDCIVKILEFFPRYSYIGYTATPFANVLNEEPGIKSLYPSNFIVMLPEKKDYFSARKIFGIDEQFEQDDGSDEKPTLDVLEIVNSTKNKIITEKLIKNAIIYFILATAVKCIRARYLEDDNLLKQHSTMMIHTSVKANDHEKMKQIVCSCLQEIKYNWNNQNFQIRVYNIWKTIYAERRNRILDAISKLFSSSKECYFVPENFSEIMKEAFRVLEKTKVKIDNYKADPTERLDYSSSNGEPNYIIAIGGNTLSRGITLEGLIVAVFARKVNTYDTLLQMGRWFGYRKKYEDLFRLWLTEDAYKKMQFLSGIEEDLKELIDMYKFNETPATLAPAIRTTPKMQIVRKLAMKAAVASSINYAGTHPQTISFKNDKKWLQDNIDSVDELINKNIESFKGHINDGLLLERVDPSSVSEFIKKYHFDENISDLNSNLLFKFIQNAELKGYLTSWNVMIKTRGYKDFSNPNPFDYKDFLLERGKIKNITDRIYLKAISSPGDIVCDIDGAPQKVKDKTNSEKFKYRNHYFKKIGVSTPGLIVIYPIAKNGQGFSKSDNRIELNAEQDVYGLSIIVPYEERISKKFYDSVSIELNNVKEIEGDDYVTD